MKFLHLLMLIFSALKLLSTMFILMSGKLRTRITKRLSGYKNGIWITPAAIWLLYIFLSVVDWNWDPRIFIKLVFYFSIPTLILQYAERTKRLLGVPDILAILSLWLPFDFRLMNDSWPVLGEFKYHTSATIAVIYTFITFCGFRRIDINASWKLSRNDAFNVLLFFVGVSAILVPLGYSFHFLEIGLSDLFQKAAWMVPLYFVTIFIGAALPEELLFRGVIQNVLTKRMSFAPALITTSVIFGLAHINNGVRLGEHLFQPPNWTYVLMATIAGLFYGGIFHKQRSLLSAMLLHTLVDFTWVMFLRG
ncbi:MAG: CPBP family intramembrane glutamic endopeptidase [Patescibacteria group bacterium]